MGGLTSRCIELAWEAADKLSTSNLPLDFNLNTSCQRDNVSDACLINEIVTLYISGRRMGYIFEVLLGRGGSSG